MKNSFSEKSKWIGKNEKQFEEGFPGPSRDTLPLFGCLVGWLVGGLVGWWVGGLVG